jgi:hypothetical protein
VMSRGQAANQSRRLVIENGTLNPALNIEVAYAVHTIGFPPEPLLRWFRLSSRRARGGVSLDPVDPEPTTESTESYLGAINLLHPSATIQGTGDSIEIEYFHLRVFTVPEQTSSQTRSHRRCLRKPCRDFAGRSPGWKQRELSARSSQPSNLSRHLCS